MPRAILIEIIPEPRAGGDYAQFATRYSPLNVRYSLPMASQQ
jgi:hypothetical protein